MKQETELILSALHQILSNQIDMSENCTIEQIKEIEGVLYPPKPEPGQRIKNNHGITFPD